MKITNKTSLIGVFQGIADNLLKPFENSKQLLRAKGLANMYIKFGKLFGIRADLAFAQMCHETGLLQFTGIAKSDWNNFCGLGVTGPGAVQKFLTEDYGVIAHYAHLAWYMYSNHINSMCSKKFDPRHFESNVKVHPRFNGDTSISRLGGSWAVPGDKYADKIVYYANIINGDITINNGSNEPEILLKNGSKGVEVTKLQKYLQYKGYDLKADGIFGPITESKVKSYQKDNGLKETGFVTTTDKKKMDNFEIPEISINISKFDIIVQMGHVGRKTGTTGAYREQEFNKKLGDAMEPLLRQSGLKYRIMGADNWLKPEPNKTRIFFSIHYDGSTNKKARGFSCGYKIGTNQRFKDTMAMSYKQLSGFQQRPDNYTIGLKNYYSWKHVDADFYLLLEHGFGSNDIEREWMFANIDRIAKHHVEVITKFLKGIG